ncbi:MAG: fumarylacetoacetate hydrolase family protein [Ectothiorhodospiraceae bacterium]|nr:fumarylacetoacetate hydrolase family protein [Planctomycetota bacterium]MCP5151784.1 fumarylacetoacetate hydrolase family protein [Chromatiales bacterium]MCP5154316.1 fumarylacetoacetate hydrolase family protein [Ectothiorhodospiraceae bacterium]
MRLCMFDKGGRPTLGAPSDDSVVDVSALGGGLPGDIASVVTGGAAAVAAVAKAVSAAPASARVPLAGLRYHLPLPSPGKIICLGLNYADHAAEGGHSKPSYPSFFMRCATSLVAHGEPMVRPRVSEQLDYEAELAAVVGQRARHVAREDALSVIAGYSVFNDGSIRQYQRLTSQWTIGKNFDATGGFGPDYVTADELPPGATGLRIQSRLNGQVMQDANTDDMLFGVAETIALLTECLTLEPGDLIVMGTPSGVGHARKPPVWMRPGDVCEVEIEKVGLLRNPIVGED